MTRLLETKALHASYGATEALHGIDLHVDEGRVTALLGANGAGKTTTLRAICHFQVKTSGSVLFRGERIDARGTEQIAALGVGHVPDGRGTFVGLTTEENLRLGCHARKDRKAVADDLERMFGYFPRLKERRGQQAGTLSGGEQQMLAIARAMAADPKLIMLDEPSEGIMPVLVDEMFELFTRLKKAGKTLLLVEQNVELALSIADRAYIMDQGSMVHHAPAAELLKDQAIQERYCSV